MSDNKDNKEQELIPVTDGEIGGVKQPAVDGRTLHGFLGSEQRFTDWVKN